MRGGYELCEVSRDEKQKPLPQPEQSFASKGRQSKPPCVAICAEELDETDLRARTRRRAQSKRRGERAPPMWRSRGEWGGGGGEAAQNRDDNLSAHGHLV